MIDYLRTPEDRFDNLPNFPFLPHYLEDLMGYEGLRLHFVDEGPKQSQTTFLCLHGEPTWSYLYRKMIPVFLETGARVVAPDFFGFGRSDKPIEESTYTFHFHREFLLRFIEKLDLENITLVCQDWGGILGLTLLPDMPNRFSRLVIMNTVLTTGDFPLGKGFEEWRTWIHAHPDMSIAKLMKRACPHLTEAECMAYDAPFPDRRFKAGVRRFPDIVPAEPDSEGTKVSRRTSAYLNSQWKGNIFLAVGLNDPVLGELTMNVLRKQIKGCPPPYIIPEGSHFLQEWGDIIAREALTAFST